MESIISEILKLEDSPFWWKCSIFHVDFRNAIKNPEKVSAVNVLTNSPNILDLTKADFFQLNLSQIHWKID